MKIKCEMEVLGNGVKRMKTIGGWIVNSYAYEAIASIFVADPNHEWELFEEEIVMQQYVSIDQLSLKGTRTMSCLLSSNIKTIDDLIKLSSYDLLKIPNFGAKCLIEVEKSLSKIGLSLNGKVDQY
ncbi:MAG TPA: DNA-directed RNA polymerase subunit alpha C-terminal domain-containing protein [Puia sp.]|nr:DNA-directed RNA polymerase subunit alpha C-terminal domain-containing protein [Puia sp.]